MKITSGIARPLRDEHLLGVAPPLADTVDGWARRLHLYTGRALSHLALSQEQAMRAGYLALRGQMRAAGVSEGLEVLIEQGAESALRVGAGRGIDAQGEDVTVPLARRVREVVGVEGEAGLVRRARENAAHNGIVNAEFHAADLGKDLSDHTWMRDGFDRLLLDPPRSGADFVLTQLKLKQFKRIVYVSCHPGSLARDAGYLVNEKGWKLRAAGVMDMFPHTAHVESIAMFEPGRS